MRWFDYYKPQISKPVKYIISSNALNRMAEFPFEHLTIDIAMKTELASRRVVSVAEDGRLSWNIDNPNCEAYFMMSLYKNVMLICDFITDGEKYAFIYIPKISADSWWGGENAHWVGLAENINRGCYVADERCPSAPTLFDHHQVAIKELIRITCEEFDG